MQHPTGYSSLPPGLWRFTPLLYALSAGCGLAGALAFGWSLHRKDLLQNSCNVAEFLPSISAAIGDFVPERQIWRFCSPFLASCFVLTLIGMHRIFCARFASRGPGMVMTGDQNLLSLSAVAARVGRLFLGQMELYEVHTVLFALRFIAAIGWTFVASFESLMVHETSFGFFAVFGIAQHAIAVTLARRSENAFLTNANPNQKFHAEVSLALSRARKYKIFAMAAQATCICLFLKFFLIDHLSHCYPYAYSYACLFEWSFSYVDLVADASYYYDMLAVDYLEGNNADPGFAVIGSDEEAQAGISFSGSSAAVSTTAAAAAASDGNQQQQQQQATTTSANDSNNNNTATTSNINSSSAANPRRGGNENDNSATSQQSITPIKGMSSAPRQATAAGGGGVDLKWLSADQYKKIAPYVWIPTVCIQGGAPRCLLWIADIFFGYLLFASFVAMSQAVYFIPMVAMTFTMELGCLMGWAIVAICLRFQAFVKMFLPSGPSCDQVFKPSIILWAVYGTAPLCLFNVLVETSPGNKLLVACIGPVCLALAFRIRTVVHSMRHAALERKKGNSQSSPFAVLEARDELRDEASRLAYAVPIGMLFSLVARYYFISVDPFFTHMHMAPIGAAIALLVCLPVLIIQERFLYIQVVVAGGSSALSPTIPAPVPSLPFGNSSSDPAKQSSSSVGGDNNNNANNNDNNNNGDVNTASTNFAESVFAQQFSPAIRYSSNVSPIHNPLIIGLSFGSVSVLAMQYCTSPNVVARLVAIDPLTSWSSLILISTFACGLLSSFLYAHPRGYRQRFAVQAMLLVGPLILFYGTVQSNKMTQADKSQLENWGANEFGGSPKFAFIGGLMFVFALGTILPATAAAFWGLPVSLGLLNDGKLQDKPIPYAQISSGLCQTELTAFLLMVTFLFVQVYTTCFPFVPGGSFFRDRYQFFLFPLALLAFFTQRYLFQPAEYYSEKDATSEEDKFSPLPSPRAGAQGGGQDSPDRLLGRFDSVYSMSDGELGPQSPVGESGVYPIPFENTRTRISVRILLAGMLLALIWRMAQQPDTASRDPFARETWIVDVVNIPRRHEIQALTAEAYERKHGISKYLSDEFLFVSDNHYAHVTAAIWTLHFALDNFGRDSLDRIVKNLRNTKASVIGLLETDSARLHTANRDILEYIAYHTNLPHTDYGPTTADGTFGCALLSRFPIVSVRRFVTPSPQGELACLIDATLEIPEHEHRHRKKPHLRVLVGHNGNTDHVQDLVLQTDLIGRIAANAAAEGTPIIFLGYVTSVPGLMGHNYYRMIQSDGRDYDRLMMRSSKTIFDHGFTPDTGKGIELPRIPLPKQRDRFRDAARDYLLWSGPLTLDSQARAVVAPWVNAKHAGEKAYWEAYLNPGAEWQFLKWIDALAEESDLIAKQRDTREWKRQIETSVRIRKQLQFAASALWDDVASEGLGAAKWVDPAKRNLRENAIDYDGLASGMHNGKIYRMFLDASWVQDNAREHAWVATRYFQVASEPPKIRMEHPRHEYEDRYCQQIYYRDVMILDWWREPIGVLSDTELQLFTFAV